MEDEAAYADHVLDCQSVCRREFRRAASEIERVQVQSPAEIELMKIQLMRKDAEVIQTQLCTTEYTCIKAACTSSTNSQWWSCWVQIDARGPTRCSKSKDKIIVCLGLEPQTLGLMFPQPGRVHAVAVFSSHS